MIEHDRTLQPLEVLYHSRSECCGLTSTRDQGSLDDDHNLSCQSILTSFTANTCNKTAPTAFPRWGGLIWLVDEMRHHFFHQALKKYNQYA